MAGASGSPTMGQILMSLMGEGRANQQRIAEMEAEARIREALEKIRQKGASRRTKISQKGQNKRTVFKEGQKAARQEDTQEHDLEKQRKKTQQDIRKERRKQRFMGKRQEQVEGVKQGNRMALEDKRIAGRRDVKQTPPGGKSLTPPKGDFPTFKEFRSDVDDRTRSIERKIENDQVVGGDPSRMAEVAANPRQEALRQIVRELLGQDLESLSFSSERDLYQQMQTIDSGGGDDGTGSEGEGSVVDIDPRVKELRDRLLERARQEG